ncbi:MAG: hypothetical protein O3A01_03545 [bacterium]|nr:hypothetical protein [bacterium]
MNGYLSFVAIILISVLGVSMNSLSTFVVSANRRFETLSVSHEALLIAKSELAKRMGSSTVMSATGELKTRVITLNGTTLEMKSYETM